MRKIKEVLRLEAACLSRRQIAHSCSISRSTVSDYLQRARQAGLSWPLPDELTEAELNRRLYPPAAVRDSEQRGWPQWSDVHRELKRKGMTLQLLWEEYKERHPEGYQYSWFSQRYRDWAKQTDVVMRQEHRGGEKLFVDYAGQTVGVVDRHSGEIRAAQIFVATLGASNYTYFEATASQELSDWLGSHVRAFEFFGGVPEQVIPDNLKSGVTQSHRYEPDINRSYAELAEHYGVAVLPARVRKPRDKAKVEAGVQLVERWVLARLRHQTFFSLSELNQAMQPLLQRLNERDFKKLPGCRRDWFEQLDQPALRALPAQRYEFAAWKTARVNIDYPVEFKRHYYSVPYTLVRQTVELRVTAQTLEVFHRGQRVACHRRNELPGRHTTINTHMPKAHRDYADWTPERLVNWAAESGPHTAQLIRHILSTRAHPQQGYRSCLGIMRLGKKYGTERLEAACQRALLLQACSYKSLESILKRQLDRQPLPDAGAESAVTPEHDNIRGPHYYH